MEDFILLEGKALKKIQSIFQFENSTWYVHKDKFYGKSIFLRDHGERTYCTVGDDGYSYGIDAFSCFPLPLHDLSQLACAARNGINHNPYEYLKLGIRRDHLLKPRKTT